MPKPQPQPGLAKRHDPHPAAAAPAAAPSAPTVPAARTASNSTAPAGDLVPLGTRIPAEMREDLRWLTYLTGTPIQALVIEAVGAYIRNHPGPPRPTA